MLAAGWIILPGGWSQHRGSSRKERLGNPGASILAAGGAIPMVEKQHWGHLGPADPGVDHRAADRRRNLDGHIEPV